MRSWLLHVHRWVGLAAGLYLALIGITGAALMFRQEMQAAAYPQFFRADRDGQPEADVGAVIRGVQAAYPEHRLSGIDWPTDRRDTFLAYLIRGSRFEAVFSHPVSGRVTGIMPFDGIRWLQDLHFNLLAGPVGLVVNGIGAACLLVMCATGLVIWWPGLARWPRALRVGFHKGWRRVTWELHGAVGAWLWALLAMWAITGMYFAFPQPVRDTVDALSPLTVARAPESTPARAGRVTAPTPDALLARARDEVPGAGVARLVLPSTERGTVQVVMARAVHGDYDTSDEVSLYFDQYTGALLLTRDHSRRTAGDTLMAWLGPLHVGSFGGLPVKLLWALSGVALPLLFATGGVMWWNRR